MKQMGNSASNEIYNPTNKRPPIPIDADEADSAMERFIRNKYKDASSDGNFKSAPQNEPRDYLRDHDSHDQQRAPVRSRRPATPDSDDNPPPPPPKKESRFGFRSASSIFPMSSKSKREAQARAHIENQMYNNPRRDENQGPTPPRKNKPSRVFGQTVGSPEEQEDNMIVKLARLRDMGFADEKRNITVLKGLNGNLEKSVETLVRLGERSKPKFEHPGPPSRSTSPATAPSSAGLSFDRPKPSPRSPSYSNNPWEVTSAAPQTAQSTGGLPPPRPIEKDDTAGSHLLNPFGFATRSQANLNQQYNSLDQSFQNLNVSNNPQQLFPNHTGGAPRQFQAGVAPPMPSIPQGQYSIAGYVPASQPTSPMPGYNPFLQTQQTSQPQTPAQPLADSNPFGSIGRAQTFPRQAQAHQPIQDFFNQPSTQQEQQNNPYGQQLPLQQHPTQMQQGNLYLQRQQTSHNPYGQPQQLQPQMTSNPYGNQFQQQQQQTKQPLMPQRTGMDKSSIMAMFNYAAPPMPSQQPQQEQSHFDHNQLQQQVQQTRQQQLQNQSPYQQQQQQPQAPLQAQNTAQPQQQIQNQNPYQQQQQPSTQSFSTSLAPVQEQPGQGASPLSSVTGFGGAKNPFMHSANMQQNVQNAQGNGAVQQGGLLAASGLGSIGQQQPAAARSRDSMLANSGWNVNNGRHSPDAFSGLSARAN